MKTQGTTKNFISNINRSRKGDGGRGGAGVSNSLERLNAESNLRESFVYVSGKALEPDPIAKGTG